MSRSAAVRREARERALHLAYECDMRGLDVDAVLAQLPVPPDAWAVSLVRGVEDHVAEIDGLLGRFAERWSVGRMPAIDRALLRIGTFELGWDPSAPTAVVIAEAVELAKRYSTTDSGRFVNGLLARIADHVRGAA